MTKQSIHIKQVSIDFFSNLSESEVSGLVQDIPMFMIVLNDCRYWNAEFYYIVATYEKRIIGILKYGKYGYGEDRYWAVSFVSVSPDFRRTGVATRMIKRLSGILLKNGVDQLHVSCEVDMGKKIGITNKIQNYIGGSKLKVVSYDQK